MSTGPKRVTTRRNVRTSTVRTSKGRGGARKGSGPKRGSKNAKITTAIQSHVEDVLRKLEGEYGYSLVELHGRTAYETKDERLRAKICGEFFVLLGRPVGGPKIIPPEAPGDPEIKIGETGLPPLKPDPAKVVTLQAKQNE